MTDISPNISFVIPVYNKADILPRAIGSLAAQSLSVPVEYIFIDDHSSDTSPAVLRDHAARLERVSILTNTRNLGPALSLNRGAQQAQGRYLCLIDADELIVPDAVATMLRLLQENNAQIAKGRTVKTIPPGGQVAPPRLKDNFDYDVFNDPLTDILNRRGFARMTWLVETDTFHQAGGCDPRVFIQDESICLRLAVKARRMIHFAAPMMYAPPGLYHLSDDHRQQHHDGFFSHYHFLCDHPDLPESVKVLLVRKCLSIAWKATRNGTLDAGYVSVFVNYIKAKAAVRARVSQTGIDLAPDWYAVLHRLARSFANMSDIRRPHARPD